MRVNIGIYSLITGQRVSVARSIELEKFIRLMEQQEWKDYEQFSGLSWIKKDFKAIVYFGTKPYLSDPYL